MHIKLGGIAHAQKPRWAKDRWNVRWNGLNRWKTRWARWVKKGNKHVKIDWPVWPNGASVDTMSPPWRYGSWCIDWCKTLKIDQVSAHDVDALIGLDGWRKWGEGGQPWILCPDGQQQSQACHWGDSQSQQCTCQWCHLVYLLYEKTSALMCRGISLHSEWMGRIGVHKQPQGPESHGWASPQHCHLHHWQGH